MDSCGAGSQCVFRRKDARKVVVIDPDQPDRLFGRPQGFSGDQDHRVSDEPDLVVAQDRLITDRDTHEIPSGDILGGKDGNDIGIGLGLFGMNLHDSSMGSVASQNLKIDHARKGDVFGIIHFSPQFFGRIDLGNGLADMRIG